MENPIIIVINSSEFESHEKLISHISKQLLNLRLMPAKKPIETELEELLEELKVEIKAYITECGKEYSEEEAFVRLFKEGRVQRESLKLLTTIENRLLKKLELEFVKPASKILLMTL